MSKDHSFDIVSEVDLQEVSNALDQSRKEIAQRYDFKGSQTTMDWNKDELSVTVHTENDMRLKSVIDILQTKFVRRGVALQNLEYGAEEKATGGSVRQVIKVLQGIPADKAREISQFIRDAKLKVQPQIQEARIRVQSPKIDLLQEVMGLVRRKDFGIALQFINYR